MKSYEDFFNQCDLDIRAGRAQDAAKRLSCLNTYRISRQWRLPLARLCRRSGLWPMGMTLLSKIVYPKNPGGEDIATANELAEYAMLLYRIGATQEAAKILSVVDTSKAPEAFHFQALVHMTKWEFPQAINALNAFLATAPPAYQSLLGRVNLALAYVENRDHQLAKQVIDEAIAATARDGYNRLLTTCLAYRAQAHIQERDFSAAKQAIGDGERSIETANTSDRQFFLKWKLVLEALERRDLTPLTELRRLARSSRNWEDLRLADLYACRIQFDMGRFLHLIFGTPFPGFRDRICQEFGQIPDRSIYYLGTKTGSRMDLVTGEIDGRMKLPLGGKSHQLLEILLRDFYQPSRIAGVFSDLFPGDHFDPESSPDRAHQVFKRTRQWLEKQKIPVKILETDGFYSLEIDGNFAFLVPLERQTVSRDLVQFEKLIALFPSGKRFSLREAEARLKLSKSTTWRIVSWGISQGRVRRVDGFYEFVSSYPMKNAAA